LILSAVFVSIPVRGQWGGSDCPSSSGGTSSIVVSTRDIHVDHNRHPGFLNSWSHSGWIEHREPFGYNLCAGSNRILNVDGNERFYVIGKKHPQSFYAGHSVKSHTGNVEVDFPVFTTLPLQNYGLGYIMYWRSVSPATSSNSSSFGVVHYPASSSWVSDAGGDVSGEPFFYKTRFTYGHACGAYPVSGNNEYATENQFLALVNNNNASRCFYFSYGVIFYVKYVLLPGGAADAYREQLDASSASFSVTTPLVIFDNRPQGLLQSKTVLHTINIKYAPLGTCTTGDVLVNLGTINQSDLPFVGSTSTPRPFTIELTNCPRVNIGYSFVMPNSASQTGNPYVLGLDSTATAQGVGVQIHYRNDPVYGNNFIYIKPSLDRFFQYERRWPLCETSGYCTNTNAGVNYSIPMQAAVYRLGNVTPGKINASVLFHIVYP